MSNLFTKANRTSVLPSVLYILASAALALGLATTAFAQQQQQTPPRPPKKKLQASSNFAQYAGRDASNRLIAGGATRIANMLDEAGTLSLKGQEAYEAGRYDESIAAFKRVTELKPTDAKSFYHLGVAYETAGRWWRKRAPAGITSGGRRRRSSPAWACTKYWAAANPRFRAFRAGGPSC